MVIKKRTKLMINKYIKNNVSISCWNINGFRSNNIPKAKDEQFVNQI